MECGILCNFDKRREGETDLSRMYMIASDMSESKSPGFFACFIICLFVCLAFLALESSLV